MMIDKELFEITVAGVTYKVETVLPDLNVYRLHSEGHTYLVAKDTYNIWVELNRTAGAAFISLTLAGKKIEEYLRPTSSTAAHVISK